MFVVTTMESDLNKHGHRGPAELGRNGSAIGNVLYCARGVASLGLRVHPLSGKDPILKDWPNRATADPAVVNALFAARAAVSYGILCDKVAVVDADTAELAAWWRRNMAETPWMVWTPHGGTHFFYRSVGGLHNAVRVGRGWDVRAGGRGYVVGFGSTVNGMPYELIGEATLDLPWFRDWLPTRASEAITLPTFAVRPRGRIGNPRAYIRRILSVQGQRGSDACFRVACIVRNEGRTAEETLELMLEWNAVAAFPPWSRAELQKKIHDCYAKLAKGG